MNPVFVPRKFRVWATRTYKPEMWYQVWLFKNREVMWAFSVVLREKLGLPLDRDKFEAETFSYRVSGGKFKNKLGDILFHRRGLGAGIVSHEMCHASIHSARRLGIRIDRLPQHKTQEDFCKLHGELVRHFWNGYYGKGKLK